MDNWNSEWTYGADRVVFLQPQPHEQLPRFLAALVGDELEQLELPLSMPPGRLPASAVRRHAADVATALWTVTVLF